MQMGRRRARRAALALSITLAYGIISYWSGAEIEPLWHLNYAVIWLASQLSGDVHNVNEWVVTIGCLLEDALLAWLLLAFAEWLLATMRRKRGAS